MPPENCNIICKYVLLVWAFKHWDTRVCTVRTLYSVFRSPLISGHLMLAVIRTLLWGPKKFQDTPSNRDTSFGSQCIIVSPFGGFDPPLC